MQGWAASALLIVCGCAAARPNVSYQRDVDQVLATPPHHDVPGAHDHAWHAGQWALYRTRMGSIVGYSSNAVVAEDACGVWLESIEETITAGRGLDTGATIGLLGLHTHDWTYGFAVSDQVALLDRDEGIRQAISAVLVIQLYIPFFH